MFLNKVETLEHILNQCTQEKFPWDNCSYSIQSYSIASRVPPFGTMEATQWLNIQKQKKGHGPHLEINNSFMIDFSWYEDYKSYNA